MRDAVVREADDLARELDLLVFSLEQPPADAGEEGLRQDRARLRRQLDKLRMRLQDLADRLAD